MTGEIGPLAHLQKPRALYLQQPKLFGIAGEGFQAVLQPRCQAGADPDHEIGLFQHRRLRGAQREIMRQGAGSDYQVGPPQIAQDLLDQPVDRRDIDRDPGHFGLQGGGEQKERGEGRAKHRGLRYIIT